MHRARCQEYAKPGSSRCPAHEHRWERGSTAAWRRLRERMIREQRGRCGSRPPTLYVHHRDGDARNDRRSNLEALCPRCHLAAHR